MGIFTQWKRFQENLERSGFFHNSLTFNVQTLAGIREDRDVKRKFETWMYHLEKKGIKISSPKMLFSSWKMKLPMNVNMQHSPNQSYQEFVLSNFDGDMYTIGIDEGDCQNYFIRDMGDEPKIDFFRIGYEGIFLNERYKMKSITQKIHSYLHASFYFNVVVVKLTIPSMAVSIHAVYRNSVSNQQEEIENLIQNIHYDFYDVDELFGKILDYLEDNDGLMRVAAVHDRLGLLSEVVADKGFVTRHVYTERNKETKEAKRITVDM